MSADTDNMMSGISEGAKLGYTIGSLTPYGPITGGIGAVIGGTAGALMSGKDPAAVALEKAHMRMATTPVSAYQSTSMMSTGQQKVAAEGAKQMGEVARGSATAGGSSAGQQYQRAQDISRNMMLGKAAAQGATTQEILKQGQTVRAAGLGGLENKVKRDHEYDVAKMTGEINQRDAEGKSAYSSPFEDLGAMYGEYDSDKTKYAAEQAAKAG